MIVCSCNVLSDREIRNAATAAQVQPLSADQVYGCLGCNMRCGRCARTVKQILSEALPYRTTAIPIVFLVNEDPVGHTPRLDAIRHGRGFSF
jgi:bacterioferritin-associated ferredoxin